MKMNNNNNNNTNNNNNNNNNLTLPKKIAKSKNVNKIRLAHFEKDDIICLGTIAIFNKTIKSKIQCFNPYKWHGNANLLYVSSPPTNKSRTTESFLSSHLEGRSYDSLYVNHKIKNKNKDHKGNEEKCIYITPHIIFFHEVEGKTTIDLLLESSIRDLFENIVTQPSLHLRSYTNKSIEFFNNDDIKNDRYPTLGTFLAQLPEQISESMQERKNHYLQAFGTFIDKIGTVFLNTLYMPYFIHPHRLFLFKNDIIKIISYNLMHYIFSPHAIQYKLRDIVYSHPLSLSTNSSNFLHFNNNDVSGTDKPLENKNIFNECNQRLKANIINLILDFFHSAFVTTLWIASVGGYNNERAINRNYICLLSGNGNLLPTFPAHNYYKQFNKNKSGNNNTSKRTLIKSMEDQSSNECTRLLFDNEQCQNPYGFCQAISLYTNNKNLANIAHRYGCHHLLSVCPIILNEAMDNSILNVGSEYLKNAVMAEFLLLKSFIEELKKN